MSTLWNSSRNIRGPWLARTARVVMVAGTVGLAALALAPAPAAANDGHWRHYRPPPGHYHRPPPPVHYYAPPAYYRPPPPVYYHPPPVYYRPPPPIYYRPPPPGFGFYVR